MTKQQQPQMKAEEMIEILRRTNQRLTNKIASIENDLALAHTQVEMLQENVQSLLQKIQQLEAGDEAAVETEEPKKTTPKKAAPKKKATNKE